MHDEGRPSGENRPTVDNTRARFQTGTSRVEDLSYSPRRAKLYLVRGRRPVAGQRQTVTALRWSFAAAERLARQWERRGWSPVTIWSTPRIRSWTQERRDQPWRWPHDRLRDTS